MRLLYKNIGKVTKTFHGVTFKPGDTKEVSNYINAHSFIRIDTPNDVIKSASTKPVSTSSSAPEPKVPTKVDPKNQKKADNDKLENSPES